MNEQATPVGTFTLGGTWNNEARLLVEVGDEWYVHAISEKLDGKAGEGKKKGYTSFHYIVRDVAGTFSGKVKRFAGQHQDPVLTEAYNELKVMHERATEAGKKMRLAPGLMLNGKLNAYVAEVDGKNVVRHNWDWFIASTHEIELSEELVYNPTA